MAWRTDICMGDSIVAAGWARATSNDPGVDRASDPRGARSASGRAVGDPIRTWQTDAHARELDRLLAREFQGARALEHWFSGPEATMGPQDRPVARASQADQFYLHRLRIQGQLVEFAVSLQATSECEPGVILRLLKQSHVLDPTCQHGRRLHVLVHRSEPLLTRR